MKFTIDRSKWRCGGLTPSKARGLGSIALLNDEGYMCCLGQISCQLGLSKDIILNAGILSDIEDENKVLTDNILLQILEEENAYGLQRYIRDTELSDNAVTINDDNAISDEERERELIKLFGDEGHEIEFINDYVFQPETHCEQVEE